MEEQLQQIKDQLYKSETNFPPLRERLQHCGELRAWFKYYHGPNQWVQRYYQEEHVYLMSHVLIAACLFNNGKMLLRTYKLDDMARIEREYSFADNTNQQLVLSKAAITFKTIGEKKRPEILIFQRPVPEEQGDPEGFEQLINLLD